MHKRKRSEIVDLSIDSIGFEGVAIARKDNIVYFVKGAIAGDKVKAYTKKKKKSYIETRLIEITEPSKDRIEPVCKYFGVCGGCSWQMLGYDNQLFWKRTHVRDAFERIGKLKETIINQVIPSKNELNYRNKMEFSFGASRWLYTSEIEQDDDIVSKNFALGLHIPGRYDKVLDVDKCYIHQELSDSMINDVRAKAIEMGITAYDTNTQKGFLRNLGIRYSLKNNNFMVNLITKEVIIDDENKYLDWYFNEFSLKYSQIISQIHTVNDTVSQIAFGEIRKIKGDDHLVESILGIDYRISPFSFFQTNSGQLDTFIGEIINTANIKPTDIVWDLYCGTGSITLPASKLCNKIIGIELVESSIYDAKINAEANNITNVDFYCEDLHKDSIPELFNNLPKPDVIIIDPPRAGMHKNLVAHLLNIKAPKIVYVSCNPATQARDCELLSEKYNVEFVTPVDMFPQTWHIEAIAFLSLK